MKSKRFAQYVCAAILAFGFGLNIQNALTGYGISKGTTSITADGGSNSDSNSCSNCCSNGCSNGSCNGTCNCSNGSTSQNGKTYYRDHSICGETTTTTLETTHDGNSPYENNDTITCSLMEHNFNDWIWVVEITRNKTIGFCRSSNIGYYSSKEACENGFDTSCK